MGILYEQMISHFEWKHLLEFFLRILLAGICGAAIGLERAKRLKEAGIRTHILVCIGAALMMIVSKYAFADLSVEGGGFFPGIDGADASRIASPPSGAKSSGWLFHASARPGMALNAS